MKKLLLATFVCGAFISSVAAEISEHAIGLRLSGGVEASYQMAMGATNRLELDLGWGGALVASGIYQWDWGIVDALNWYVGPGAQVALWREGVGVGVGGQIGIEYDFNGKGAPILLSIDVRPMMGLPTGDGFDVGYDAALAVRYTF